MSVAKTIEMSADSKIGFEDAIKKEIKKASTSVELIQQAWINDQVATLCLDRLCECLMSDSW